ncbi:MAG: hypothetical protein NXI32_07830 [bacterium]|nr:hypothetical protein [bacterium]
MPFDRLKALSLLSECTGDDIWSLEYCHSRGVPRMWVDDLRDCFESNPQRESESIFLQESPINQYEGLRDVDLACKLGEFLGIDVQPLAAFSLSRADLVRRIQEAVDET